jgi:RHH-type proline utilization regulon transcriptional repressor/proline dehydrogenase/delta 1-pyrroline-5-carboxylate dehydrogenase
MLSRPRRNFCESIVSGLTGVRAYALAYPRCFLKTARINASHLRPQPPVHEEIARLRAQPDTIAGPAVLALIKKRRWLSQTVRANLALLNPKIDGQLLVSLEVEVGRNKPHVSKIRIADRILAIKLNTHLAGDETSTSIADDEHAALLRDISPRDPLFGRPGGASLPAQCCARSVQAKRLHPRAKNHTGRVGDPRDDSDSLRDLVGLAQSPRQLPGVKASSALIDQAVALARVLQERATHLQTGAERRQQAELDRMLQTPEDKIILVELTDRAFRAKQAARVAEQFTHILDVQGVPRFFSPLDRALLRGFQTFGNWLPGVAVPLVQGHMQQETANVVLPAEPELLVQHLRARAEEGVRMNLNFLGEALLGEGEATRRLEKYVSALHLPEVEVLSVKISTIYSQISPIAREHTVRVLCDRLARLFREAAALEYVRPDGTRSRKFIYLDMEEYRDLYLTAEAFMRTLDRPGLEQVSAGIALQAYIPDSLRVQRTLNAWAEKRVAGGGSPVRIRLVKGANLEAERVEASIRGWPQAPFRSKRETDANFKRMLHEAFEHLHAVLLGVGTHNLFELAYALVLTEQRAADESVDFEMLEGMANHQRRAVRERNDHLLLYAPACRKEEFLNAIGYLIRRLDENTGEENFLRHAFKLQPGSEEWELLEHAFRSSFRPKLSGAPRRTQDRRMPLGDKALGEMPWNLFENEPDTDFSVPQNSLWAADLVEEKKFAPALIPLALNGGDLHEDRETRPCLDPSRPGVALTQYALATEVDVHQAVTCARADGDNWRALSVDVRNAILGHVAQELRKARGALIHAAIANGGKTIAEADPEVSEAVDFVEFYRASARAFYELPQVHCFPRGVVAVVPPWNFPIAIPCGGIAAALAAGNTVIVKPASDTVLIAWELCCCFWRAGISKRVLQFLPCSGAGTGAQLVTHDGVDAVILTGGTDTALRMLAAKPNMRLCAETGGKNAIIVTALSDREQAIKHVVHSAFSHAGQKCSATSLLLLEAEVYDDPEFRRVLCDAVESVRIGPAWDLATRMGPLIRAPSGELLRALTTLEPGESWAVQPHPEASNPNLWSPGVKYGVQPESHTHLTEFFGPLLGVLRYERIEEAIALVNATGYGLTSGIQSLDERETALWQNSIRAGNLYINKPTTGAIVLRQPFGGLGKSCFGPGMKAGGPNYVAQFMEFADKRRRAAREQPLSDPNLETFRQRVRSGARGERELPRLLHALESYSYWQRAEFHGAHDHFRLLGEDNVRRYLAIGEVRIRVDRRDSWFEIFARACAAKAAGNRVTISVSPGKPVPAVQMLDELTAPWAGGIEFVEESDEALGEIMRRQQTQRLRFAAPEHVPPLLRQIATETGLFIADAQVLVEGRIEMLWYVREQSISHAYHRYGNLGARAAESRAEPE